MKNAEPAPGGNIKALRFKEKVITLSHYDKKTTNNKYFDLVRRKKEHYLRQCSMYQVNILRYLLLSP